MTWMSRRHAGSWRLACYAHNHAFMPMSAWRKCPSYGKEVVFTVDHRVSNFVIFRVFCNVIRSLATALWFWNVTKWLLGLLKSKIVVSIIYWTVVWVVLKSCSNSVWNGVSFVSIFRIWNVKCCVHSEMLWTFWNGVSFVSIFRI